MASSIKEAEQIENILTDNGIDFAVSLEEYIVNFFISERQGIAFYVSSGQEHYSRDILTAKVLASCLTVEPEKE